MRRSRLALRTLTLICLVSLVSTPRVSSVAQAVGASATASEVELKAALIYKFTWFTSWPADAFSSSDAPLRLCVMGDDVLADALAAAVRGRTTNGHPVHTGSVRGGEGLIGCHVVFLGAAIVDDVDETIAAIRDRPTLSISEAANFCERGGMINLQRKGRRFSFAIHREAVEQVGLALSSQLLKLAHIVRDQDRVQE